MRPRKILTLPRLLIATAITLVIVLGIGSLVIGMRQGNFKQKDDDVIVLRVCNWEEYIDEGGWGEDEVIDLESGDIFGDTAVYEEFEDWYYETYGKKVRVEYSCFGTNEELYNMLTIGDEFDLVCPSDYMIMKLMAEDEVVPFSEEFFDESDPNNYYIKGVSPYIRNAFETNEIDGKPWSEYAAGYMWGVTGILYNPEKMSREDASTWKVFTNKKYKRQITLKDNVRDSLFAAVGAVKADKLLSEEFINDPDYHKKLAAEMNDVSQKNIDECEKFLKESRNNVYSFETDAGKADMITGKVVANYQWSGDAVYAMDQADEDDFYLEFAIPEECTDLWFDGWIMLKDGIKGNADKQHAAEAFVNYLSRPDIAVRDMYYIGYTSVISGGDDPRIFEYLAWNYEAEDDEEDVVDYPLGYFFSGDDSDEEYVITASKEQARRQLYAQYPPLEDINRSAIMQYFPDEANKAINKMWINVRCKSVKDISVIGWIAYILVFILLGWLIVKARKLN